MRVFLVIIKFSPSVILYAYIHRYPVPGNLDGLSVKKTVVRIA